MKIAILAAACLAALGVPALAQDSQPVPAQPGAGPAPDRAEGKNYESTRSNISRKPGLTEAIAADSPPEDADENKDVPGVDISLGQRPGPRQGVAEATSDDEIFVTGSRAAARNDRAGAAQRPVRPAAVVTTGAADSPPEDPDENKDVPGVDVNLGQNPGAR